MVSNSLQGVSGGGWEIPVILALDSVFVHKHTNLFGTVNGSKQQAYKSGTEDIKIKFMLNSVEHEIFPAHKC